MVTRYALGSVGCGVFVCILCGIMKCSINVASHAGPAPCITVLTTGAVYLKLVSFIVIATRNKAYKLIK
jgi:hypothetical protein